MLQRTNDEGKFIQPTNDPLALVSNASVQQYPTQSSMSPQSSNEPSPAPAISFPALRKLPQCKEQCYINRQQSLFVQDVLGRTMRNNQGRPISEEQCKMKCVKLGSWRSNRDGNVIRVTNFDDDVDDLALNVDHVFEADQCDAFDSDVDEAPIRLENNPVFIGNLGACLSGRPP
ncbi:hypothetical protein Tco_1483953 [Tanacetum coccineum]